MRSASWYCVAILLLMGLILFVGATSNNSVLMEGLYAVQLTLGVGAILVIVRETRRANLRLLNVSLERAQRLGPEPHLYFWVDARAGFGRVTPLGAWDMTGKWFPDPLCPLWLQNPKVFHDLAGPRPRAPRSLPFGYRTRWSAVAPAKRV